MKGVRARIRSLMAQTDEGAGVEDAGSAVMRGGQGAGIDTDIEMHHLPRSRLSAVAALLCVVMFGFAFSASPASCLDELGEAAKRTEVVPDSHPQPDRLGRVKVVNPWLRGLEIATLKAGDDTSTLACDER